MNKKLTIGYYSDLHLESHFDGGENFISLIPKDYNPDVMILAGDISDSKGITKALRMLCKRFKRVIHVCGNHEYYGGSRDVILGHLAALVGELDNYWWLDNASVTIEGQRFVGSTMWFTNNPTNVLFEHRLNDFRQIEDYKSWVYEEGDKSIDYLLEAVGSDDIVITHHLPLVYSVPTRFQGSEINRFYVNRRAWSVINNCSPKVWIHGHTHEVFDYLVSDTRVVTNPCGYLGEDVGSIFNDTVLL